MVPTTPQRVKREFGDDYSNSPAALSRRQAAKRIKVEPAVEVSETFSTVEEIKYDLSMVLSSLPSSNRAFSFSLPCSSLEHLPIPLVGLEITGIGGIGMPLAVRDALAIQSLAARRARVVESLGVESPDGPTHLPASLISLHNPVWDSFIRSTLLPSTCKALSTNLATTDIRIAQLAMCDHRFVVKFPLST